MLLTHKTYLLFLFSLLLSSAESQIYRSDSLKQVLATNIHDTVRARTLIHLANAYIRKGELKIARGYAYRALDLATRIDYKRGMRNAYNALGNIHVDLSDNAKAIEYHQRSLNIGLEMGDKKSIATSYNNFGIIYFNLAEYPRSIEYLQKALKIQEQLGNKYYVAACIGNLALLYDKIGEDSLALIYQQRSFNIHEEMGNKTDMVLSLNHLGSLHRVKKEFPAALKDLNRAISIANEIGEIKGKAESYGNFGLLYYDMGKYKESVEEFQQGLAISKQLEDKKIQSEQLVLLGNSYSALKDKISALKSYQLALDLAKEIGSLDDERGAATGMYQLHKKEGNSAEALLYHEMLTDLKDSIFNTAKNNSFNNLKMQFALDRQEHELKTKAEEELMKKEAEKQQQRIITYVIIFILIVVLAFSYFLFKRIQITNSQKKIIEEQKLLVETKNREVTDSILYAKRIQQTLLAQDDFLDQHLPDHFVFYKPKDLVSGDFYWATKGGAEGRFYLAVCDSTGHGVPGAFMSLLNISFLNEAVNEKKLSKPNEILNHVRRRLISGISTDGAKDGMDAILLCFDFINNTLSYAAAQNKSVLIRNSEFIELNYDKMPVGLGENTNSFTEHTVKLEKGDQLYLYTDGYADQFGGEKGKKFKYKRLNELLLENHRRPLAEQKNRVETELEKWKGNLEQVDDICLVCIQV
jgi:serine phosphatase RsbU (regulator of sigma subunit)